MLLRVATPTTLVVQAAGGLVRTVLGVLAPGEALLALHSDNPLCAALGEGPVVLMAPDGRTFHAYAAQESLPSASALLVWELQSRLSQWRQSGSAVARVYRLVVGSMAAAEKGRVPQT
jgi:hypothetical protein